MLFETFFTTIDAKAVFTVEAYSDFICDRPRIVALNLVDVADGAEVS